MPGQTRIERRTRIQLHLIRDIAIAVHADRTLLDAILDGVALADYTDEAAAVRQSIGRSTDPEYRRSMLARLDAYEERLPFDAA